MSRAMVCDECNSSLIVNERGDDEWGESAAWLRLRLADTEFDLCTRACLHAFIDREAVVAAHDGQAESIAEVVRGIREARAEQEGDDD